MLAVRCLGRTKPLNDKQFSSDSPLCLGIDIGSTTAKLVLLENDTVIFQTYERHLSCVRQKTLELLEKLLPLASDRPLRVALSGSAGLGLAQTAGIPFVQEVFATGEVVRALEPDASAVIELGGEDAKIIFFGAMPEERMNGSCAGGTGASIDQMATLLNVTTDQMDALSLQSTQIYPIASRCGVFAKTDVQPLLNQGARKEDIAASIFQAVVNQTVAGLARGRKINGKVLFLGGPLHFCKGLGLRFRETLKLSDSQAVFPEYALISVAMGAAMYARESGAQLTLPDLIRRISLSREEINISRALPPLFESEEALEDFRRRHALSRVEEVDIAAYEGDAYLGIDCGSTTTKLVLLSADKRILYSYYTSNRGEPVEVVLEQLKTIRSLCAHRIRICGSAVTGYGEELIRNAFGVDLGVVETLAHYTAAKHFDPQVDFILDIGGQDIKCFRIKNGAIDSIMLNEACSSGCGSFLETFARSLGTTIAEFADRGLFAKTPVDLGSRCTVFMNSMVKQCQKDGATVEDISAGLSVSVVKNALYKVIRAGSADELGRHVVVQGGTFYNDAVLRAFETELGRNVTRPAIAGLMGAYGAALCAMRLKHSALMSTQELQGFSHTAVSAVCKGCTNYCHLTVNTFNGGRRVVSGNRCEKGAGLGGTAREALNLYEYKRSLLSPGTDDSHNRRLLRVGLPLALGMMELLPLWKGFFESLGFGTVVSGPSSKRLYEKGQFTIPSDTVCYPAKLMHGHVEQLLDEKVDAVFYPCLSYNVDEKKSDNCYNCPVVAYYSELLKSNMERLKDTRFLFPFLDINHQGRLARGLYHCLKQHFDFLTLGEVKRAVSDGWRCYENYLSSVKEKGREIMAQAREKKQRIMVLAGRPYHADPEIGHGIDNLAASLGFAVVSEDAVCDLVSRREVRVLDQWTYHSRLYRAAQYAVEHPDVQLVQLVSFGCGVDAITTDEVRSILEQGEKFYTQIKIDEITNLGAVKIRLRSLLGALEEQESNEE